MFYDSLGQMAAGDTTVGSTPYNDTTPAVGYYKCYQFVINSQSKIDSLAALPAGINGSLYLYYVDPNTGQLTTLLDSDQSPNSPLLVQSVNQNVRLVFVVQPSNGAGGQTFQLGALNRPGFDSHEPNDKTSTPKNISMNQTVSANIDVAGIDKDYYFFPLVTGQTSSEIKATFTAYQTAGFRLAQKTSSGAYSLGSETAMSSGGVYRFTGLPVQTPATPYGIMLRVSGNNPVAPAGQTYSARVGVGDGWISGYNEYNTENISRRFPEPSPSTSGLQTATYIGLSANVTGPNGNPVVGEPVVFEVWSNKDDNATYQTVSAITDSTGKAYVPQINFSSCTGTTRSASYSSTSSPADHWNGTAQTGKWDVVLPYAFPASQNVNVSSQITFIRVCTETYLGRY